MNDSTRRLPEGRPPQALGCRPRTRSFARERPAAFRLVLSPAAEENRLAPEIARRSSATVLRIAGELADPEHALEARTLTAWASGFVAMELAGAFRMGGDVDAAFDFGVERLADALAG